MIVLVCGFSASGKSFLVKAIAKRLNYSCLHTSDILKQLASGVPKKKLQTDNTKMNDGWYESSGFDKMRKKDLSLDRKLDEFLLSFIKKSDNFVLDSWTLPYLIKDDPNVIKIWLDGTIKERAKRLSLRDKVPYSKAYSLLKDKDDFSTKHFKKLYGFTLGKDKDVFDLVIDTTKYSIKEVEQKTMIFLKSRIK